MMIKEPCVVLLTKNEVLPTMKVITALNNLDCASVTDAPDVESVYKKSAVALRRELMRPPLVLTL